MIQYLVLTAKPTVQDNERARKTTTEPESEPLTG